MRACGARERETAAPAAQLPLPRVPSSLPSYPELLSVLLTLKRGPRVPLGGAWSCLRASRPPWCQLTSSRPISWQPAPAAGAGNVPLQNWMCGSRGVGLHAAPSPLASGLWSTLCGTPRASLPLASRRRFAFLSSEDQREQTGAALSCTPAFPGRQDSSHPLCPAWGVSEPLFLCVSVFPNQSLAPAATAPCCWPRGPVF